MKRWAILTTILYALLLAALVWPTVVVAFLPDSLPRAMNGRDILGLWGEPWYGSPLGCILGEVILVLVLCQVLLLVVPVKIASRRPVTRKHLAWPITGALLATGLLITCSLMSVHEYLSETGGMGTGNWIAGFGVVGAMWFVWAFLFGFYVGKKEPAGAMGTIARFLVAGSVLELLISVPAHIVARMRNYCCAGMFTTWGLWTGIAVVLLAFGPATFILFARRYKSIKNQGNSPGGEPP